jgi:prepilin-type N-terminal cleavage/methylation domain-containing protein
MRLALKDGILGAQSGFTLTELVTVLFMMGILSAIAVPSWLSFIYHYELRAATDRAYWAKQKALSNAKRDKMSWQASFRQQGDRLQWAVHRADIPPSKVSPNEWNSFEGKVRIDNLPNDKNKIETTLLKVDPDTNREKMSGSVHRVIFNYQGCPVYNRDDECGQTSLEALGRLTLTHPDLGKKKRCVFISTILGTMRVSEEQPKADSNGRYCY